MTTSISSATTHQIIPVVTYIIIMLLYCTTQSTESVSEKASPIADHNLSLRRRHSSFLLFLLASFSRDVDFALALSRVSPCLVGLSGKGWQSSLLSQGGWDMQWPIVCFFFARLGVFRKRLRLRLEDQLLKELSAARGTFADG